VSFAFEVKLTAATRRRIRARASAEPLSESELRALLAEAETADEDGLYAAYCAAVGIEQELVEVPGEDMAAIREGLRKGEAVEREIAAEREQEARAFAEQERREIAEAEKLYPLYLATLGVS
jgi:hypothetical protein